MAGVVIGIGSVCGGPGATFSLSIPCGTESAASVDCPILILAEGVQAFTDRAILDRRYSHRHA
jgi:hypothetical protein